MCPRICGVHADCVFGMVVVPCDVVIEGVETMCQQHLCCDRVVGGAI